MKFIKFLYLTVILAALASCSSSDNPAPEGNNELVLSNIFAGGTEWDLIAFAGVRRDSNVVSSINSDAISTLEFSYTRYALFDVNDTTCHADDTFFIGGSGNFEIRDNSSTCNSANYATDVPGLVDLGGLGVTSTNEILISGEDFVLIDRLYGLTSYSGIYNENDYLANFDFRSSSLNFQYIDSTANGTYRFRYTDEFSGLNIAIQEDAKSEWTVDLHVRRR